jgi:hypothetical protein
MAIYIKDGKEVSKEAFYHSEYNHIFIAVYNAYPDNINKALLKIRSMGCSPAEACQVLVFAVGIGLAEASLTVQSLFCKAD